MPFIEALGQFSYRVGNVCHASNLILYWFIYLNLIIGMLHEISLANFDLFLCRPWQLLFGSCQLGSYTSCCWWTGMVLNILAVEHF